MAVSITQATEIGTVYSLDDIAAISAIAARHGLPLHMDGARFANALVALDTTPAEMTWKRGVDILSFGGTKNGCWCAEAIVLFDLDRGQGIGLPPQARRAAVLQVALHRRPVRRLFRGRAVAGDGAPRQRHGRAAGRGTSSDSQIARLAWQPQANEVFAVIDEGRGRKRLQAAGAAFYDWHTPHGFDGQLGEDEELCRFVTSFATTDEDGRSSRHCCA